MITARASLSSLIAGIIACGSLPAADYPKGNVVPPAGWLTLNNPKTLPTGVRAVGQTFAASVDLRGTSLPKPGYQIAPSCVGWATTYALKTYQEAKSNGWDVYNGTTKILSPYWTYDNIPHAGDGGSWIPDALEFLRTRGSDHGTHYWPSYGGKPPPGFAPESSQAMLAHAMSYQCSTWVAIPQSLDGIKSILTAGRPVVIGIYTRAQFDNLGPNAIYNDTTSGLTGSHAVSIIGYDDAKSAFLIINSWGTAWGTNGYGWVSYNQLGNAINQAYDVSDRPANEAMLCGTVSGGINNGAGYRFRVLHTANPPADMNSSITNWNLNRPNAAGAIATFTASATVCELAASEQIILHPGTTFMSGSNAWIHVVPITQAAVN